MRKGALKIAGIFVLLAGLYAGTSYFVNYCISNRINIVSEINNTSSEIKHRIKKEIKKTGIAADLIKKEIAVQLEEDYLHQKEINQLLIENFSNNPDTGIVYRIKDGFQKIILIANSLEDRIKLQLGEKGNSKTELSKNVFVPKMNPLFLHGKSLDDYFREFDGMIPEQQEYFAKSLNSLSVWDIVLLSRYTPIDGILRSLSSFYSTDYKWHLQGLLSESTLDPMKIGPTEDRGCGQLTPESEKWARELYSKSGYKFPGQEIGKNIFDPYTNLVLSSIIFRKDAEERILSWADAYSLYSNGFKGVERNKEGIYVTNAFGLEDVERAKRFDYLTDRLIIFSWLGMERNDLGKYIEDESIRKVIGANNSKYDARIAYEGMIDFLNSEISRRKYSEKDMEVFKGEIINISNWLKELYNSSADSEREK